MSERLLREYLNLVIERIKTKRDSKSKLGSHFNLKMFKTLPNIDTMLSYAGEYLQKLGAGSSRAAFLLSGKYVLKIALNEKGLGQNEAELDVYTNSQSRPIVAKIYDADDDNRWLVSDLVKPVTDKEEFENLAGVDWRTFSSQVSRGLKHDLPQDANSFVKAVVATARSNSLKQGDLVDSPQVGTGEAGSVMGHWGKTPEGRIVLLDYGFTEGVWTTHYEPEHNARQKAWDPFAAQWAGRKDDGPQHVVISPKNGNKSVDSFAKTQRDQKSQKGQSKAAGSGKVNKHDDQWNDGASWNVSDDTDNEKTQRDRRKPMSRTMKAG